MKVELIAHTPTPEKVCTLAARLCYSPGMPRMSQITPDNARPLLEKVLDSGHLSILEHASFTFAVEGISRVCSHQLVRHRHASYAQQSQRYVKEGNREVVTPESIRNHRDPAVAKTFEQFVELAYEVYGDLLDAGVPAEDARFVLPNAAQTKIVVTMNARELRHFFALRCCARAQWEIRALADEMLRLVKLAAPALFEGAGPGCVTGACPEGAMTCGKPLKEVA